MTPAKENKRTVVVEESESDEDIVVIDKEVPLPSLSGNKSTAFGRSSRCKNFPSQKADDCSSRSMTFPTENSKSYLCFVIFFLTLLILDIESYGFETTSSATPLIYKDKPVDIGC